MSGESETDDPDLVSDWDDTRTDQSVRDRVYDVAIQLYEPARVATVAERADCAKETARDYLRWFVQAGILVRTAQNPERFERNDAYFEWKRVFELQQRPREELDAELSALAEREREFRERYDAERPAAVRAVEHTSDDDIEAVWDDLDEWETIREQIRRIDRARRAQSDSGGSGRYRAATR